MKTIAKALLGKEGEERVVAYLRDQGFTILACNYRKTYGEIDIIAHNKQLLIFVEVKTRYACKFDFSVVVTPTKQRKIGLVAREFITRHTQYHDKDIRFDVALVDGIGQEQKLTYIPHAFVIER